MRYRIMGSSVSLPAKAAESKEASIPAEDKMSVVVATETATVAEGTAETATAADSTAETATVAEGTAETATAAEGTAARKMCQDLTIATAMADNTAAPQPPGEGARRPSSGALRTRFKQSEERYIIDCTSPKHESLAAKTVCDFSATDAVKPEQKD
jgi:hypothetical protein